MPEQEIICVGCPLGCHVVLKISDKGEIENLAGNQCKEGKEYVIGEFHAPVRVFTAAVLIDGGRRLLPVKTDKPIHKNQFKELMCALSRVRVQAPVKPGQVIIHNILGMGVDLVATGKV